MRVSHYSVVLNLVPLFCYLCCHCLSPGYANDWLLCCYGLVLFFKWDIATSFTAFCLVYYSIVRLLLLVNTSLLLRKILLAVVFKYWWTNRCCVNWRIWLDSVMLKLWLHVFVSGSGSHQLTMPQDDGIVWSIMCNRGLKVKT